MRDRIVDEVRRRALVAPELLAHALQLVEVHGGTLPAQLTALGVAPDVLLQAYEAATGLTRAPHALITAPEREAARGCDGGLLWRLMAVPFANRQGSLHIAFADPELAAHAQLLGLPKHVAHLARPDEVVRALELLFGPAPQAETSVSTPAAWHATGAQTELLPPRAVASPLPPTMDAAVDDAPDPFAPAGAKAIQTTVIQTTVASVDRFRVVSTLGEGGMATVYRAEDKTTGRFVALKVIQEHHAADQTFIERFRREVQATAALRHPNIVEVIDWSAGPGTRYMASELMEAGDLHKLKDRIGRFPALLAARAAYDLLAGLGHAHANGLIHRDVKPANLLLSTSGTLKITDFGIAKVAGDATLTQTGFLVGTPAYMSPEQTKGDPVGPPSDLFSAGIVLYELLTGRNPFYDQSPAVSLMRIGTGAAPPIFEVDPSIPGLLEGVLERLLALDPAQRFASADEALLALRPLVELLDETMPGAMALAVVDPVVVRGQLIAQQGLAELARGESLLHQGEAALPRAAFAFLRAVLLLPQDARARAALDESARRGNFKFFTEQSPRLAEAHKALLQTPDAPGLLKRASDIARADGDLLASAIYLKRYLKIRPQDTHASMQLMGLVGDVDMAAPLAAGGTSVLVAKLDTKAIIAGVKTGGMKALIREGGLSVPQQPPRVVELVASESLRDASVMDIVRGLVASYGKLAFVLCGMAFALWLVVQAVGAFIEGSKKAIDDDNKRMEQAVRRRPDDATTLQQRELMKVAAGMANGGALDDAAAKYGEAIGLRSRSDPALESFIARARIHIVRGRKQAAIDDVDAALSRAALDDPRRLQALEVQVQARAMP